MKAVKGNKEYTINETTKNHYQQSGFDIKDDDGNVIAYGKGKTVPYEDYKKIADELEALKNGNQSDEFSKMSLEELKAYATENEIDTGNATSEKGIVKKIREALQGKE